MNLRTDEDVILRGEGGELTLAWLEWFTAMALVGLHGPGRRGWAYFRRGDRLTAEDAANFADDLEAASHGLGDGLAPGDLNIFPAALSKAVARRIVAFAREGEFQALQEVQSPA
jgi:hypothetical protein